MNHTPQIKKALQFAARKHDGQYRKEIQPLPYITHLISVALLVAEGGADDDTVTAALLHDTIEDTATTREEIAHEFNERVANLVETVTEPKDAELSWRMRKEHYLAKIEAGSDEALLVSLADKIDNIESKVAAFEREGAALLARWQQPFAEYLWYHEEVARIAKKRLPDHPLTLRLVEAVAYEAKTLAGA